MEVCDNSLDDDSDGLTDTDDLNDCPIGIGPMIEGNMTEDTLSLSNTNVTTTEICDDFVDNDGDNLIDSDDIQDCPLSTEAGEGGAANGTATTTTTPTPTIPIEESSDTSLQSNVSDITSLPEIVFVIVCNDGTPANDGSCTDGSQPLTVSTEELICNDGNHPDANVICVDGSQPKFASTVGGGAIVGSPSPSPTTATPVSPASQASICNPSSATLVRNAKGPEVTDLQNILITLGYSVGPKGADGDFGANTEGSSQEIPA